MNDAETKAERMRSRRFGKAGRDRAAVREFPEIPLRKSGVIEIGRIRFDFGDS